MSRLLYFLRQKWVPPANPTTSFKGKNIIVTGSNSGLGFEAALKFTSLDASTVILGVRDLSKGAAAKAAIEERTGKKDVVSVWHLDMNSYSSIKNFAAQAERLDRLDVSVLNAGVFMVEYQKSPYGWEEDLQVNVLSTALLGMLLLAKLKASKTTTNWPVLEFVSSDNHERVVIPHERRKVDNLLMSYNTKDGFRPGEQYWTSKLFVMYVMQTLALYAKSKDPQSTRPDVLVTSVCPGACRSNLSRGLNGFAMNLIKAIYGALFLRTAEQGARTLVSGTNLGKEAHGRFWQHDIIKPPAPLVSTEGEELRKIIWDEIVEGLKKDVPEVTGIFTKLEGT